MSSVGEALRLEQVFRRVYTFPLDAFAQTCLLQGVDELGYLAARLPDIERYETTHAR